MAKCTEPKQNNAWRKLQSPSRQLWHRLAVLCVLTLPIILVGCIGVPGNAIKLSELQIQHLEQYQKSVQSIIDSHRVDAEALIAERDRGYDRLLERGEDIRKELYRLASHLLSREPIGEQSQRFQESLTDSDREVVRMLEQHINLRIGRYKTATSWIEIDVTTILKLKQQNNMDEIRKVLDRVPSGLVHLRRSLENFLMHEPFDEVRSLAVSKIEEINKEALAESPDVARLGNDLGYLVGKIDQVETALDNIRAKQVAYRAKAKEVLDQLNTRLKGLESAGNVVVQTQKDLRDSLRLAKSIDVQATDILVSISPLIDSLGQTGVIDKDEAKAITEIVSSIKDSLKNEEK